MRHLHLRSSPSEVRLLGARSVGIAVVVIILMEVFSTDDFGKNTRSRHIGQGRGPRRREDALVLDRQVQLQELAPVVAEDIALEQPILFLVLSMASFTSSYSRSR